MFRSMLTGGFSVTDLGEVFRPKDVPCPHDFHPYLVERVRRHPEDAVPHAETCARMFDDYVAGVCEANPASSVIFDLTYPHTHILNALWHQPGDPPHIVELIKERNFPIIHLVCRNALSGLASMKMAHTTGPWVVRHDSDDPVPVNKVSLDTGSLLVDLMSTVKTVRFFEDCLSDYPNTISLDDETLLRTDSKDPVPVSQLAEFLGQPLQQELILSTPENAPSLRDLIANYDEVAILLRKTAFADMLTR